MLLALARVAQLEEHRTYDAVVVGSSPTVSIF